MATDLAPRLKGRYKSEIAPALKSKFGYKNVMQIPTLTKVVVNMGVGEAARDSKLIEGAIKDLAKFMRSGLPNRYEVTPRNLNLINTGTQYGIPQGLLSDYLINPQEKQ